MLARGTKSLTDSPILCSFLLFASFYWKTLVLIGGFTYLPAAQVTIFTALSACGKNLYFFGSLL